MKCYLEPEIIQQYKLIKTIIDEHELNIDLLYMYIKYGREHFWISLTVQFAGEKLPLISVKYVLVRRISYHLTYLAIGVSSTN